VKDSPSSKLLFAKDVPRYREILNKFYANVRESPKVSDEDMNQIMLKMSKVRQHRNTVITISITINIVVVVFDDLLHLSITCLLIIFMLAR